MYPTIRNFSPTTLQSSPYLSILTPIHVIKFKSHPQKPFKISCCGKDKETITDEILAKELAGEISKLEPHIVKREAALKKSRELLFSEICGFTGLKSEDLRKQWRRMSEEERCVLAKGFVAEWSAHFHPLSARSVKEMVEEYLGQDNELEMGDNSVSLFLNLRKFLGFSTNSSGKFCLSTLCVKPSLRPLSMAISTASIHVFGDNAVFSPCRPSQDHIKSWRASALIVTSVIFLAAAFWFIEFNTNGSNCILAEIMTREPLFPGKKYVHCKSNLQNLNTQPLCPRFQVGHGSYIFCNK